MSEQQVLETVTKPTYDKDALKTGIVHIGPSAFFRGHLAVIVDELIEKGESDLAISAVSLKTGKARDELQTQGYDYTVVEQTATGNKAHVVGSLKNILVAPENPQAVVDMLSSPDVKLVTLTVTQAGYYYKNGALDFEHPDIRKDLEKADEPTSTVGLLVTALDKRRREGHEPFTVLSCDNLPGNGHILRNVVLAYAAQHSPELKDWIENKVAFPSTMVDRIVPQISDENIAACKKTYGYDDKCPIYTENFMQFVIEKPQGGTSLAGLEKSPHVTVVDDVAPHELMKIRLLNGTHMALGIAGRMAGYTHTHEAIQDPKIRSYITDLMSEMEQTLPPVPGADMEKYKQSILTRLENPAMKDELARLARNGVDKVESRFLAPLREATANGGKRDCLTHAVASWVEYLKKSGPDFDIYDQKAVKEDLPNQTRRDGEKASTLLASGIFGPLSYSSSFQSELEDAMAVVRSGTYPEKATPAITAAKQKWVRVAAR